MRYSVTIDVPRSRRSSLLSGRFGVDGDRTTDPDLRHSAMRRGADRADGEGRRQQTRQGNDDVRRYERHWTPVHIDFHVDDFAAVLDRALEAGGKCEQTSRRQAPADRLLQRSVRAWLLHRRRHRARIPLGVEGLPFLLRQGGMGTFSPAPEPAYNYSWSRSTARRERRAYQAWCVFCGLACPRRATPLAMSMFSYRSLARGPIVEERSMPRGAVVRGPVRRRRRFNTTVFKHSAIFAPLRCIGNCLGAVAEAATRRRNSVVETMSNEAMCSSLRRSRRRLSGTVDAEPTRRGGN